MSTADTAAPKGKLPSTVKSGKFNTRNVTYTPKAIMPYTRPCSMDPLSATQFNDVTLSGGIDATARLGQLLHCRIASLIR